MLTDNGSDLCAVVSRAITYTHMRAADGSDDRAFAWTCFWRVLKGLMYITTSLVEELRHKIKRSNRDGKTLSYGRGLSCISWLW